jgi:hypothetical protein
MQQTAITLTLSLFFAFNICAYAQKVSGKISSSQNESLPYATIMVEETRLGTTSNEQGLYEIQLPQPGTYHISFQMLGFKKQSLIVTLTSGENQIHNITLEDQTYVLNEVKVKSGGEDPAYAIMRRVIAMAPYYKKQVDSWKSQVYLKGSLIMKNIPFYAKNKIEVNGIKLKEGKTYTNESINEISYQAPNTYDHKVISSHSTFPSDDSNNPITYITINFYDAKIGAWVGPLAPQAFSYYKYTYEGFFKEGDRNVFKIKITPKMSSQQLVEGTIFINDKLWNIHSIDVSNEQFFGKINIREIFTRTSDDVWLPATHRFDMNASIAGIKADVNYAGSVKYLDVKKNTRLEVPSLISDAVAQSAATPEMIKPLSENASKIDALMKKEKLTNRDVLKLTSLMEKEERKNAPRDTTLEIKNNYHLKNTKDTVQRDSSYWNTMRPIPLSTNEIQSFKLNDSIKLAKTARPDTLITPKKKHMITGIIGGTLGGHTFTNKDTTLTFRYAGILNPTLVGFNPVDGFWLKQKCQLTWKIKKNHVFDSEPMARYCFGQKATYWNVNNTLTFAPLRRGKLWLNGGMDSYDFNVQGTSVLVNTIYNLILKENYIHHYQKNYAVIGQNIDLANGLQLTTQAGYARMIALQNSTNFSFYDNQKPYKPNQPDNTQNIISNLVNRDELSSKIKLIYTPQFKYIIRDGAKRMVYSKYPTFELGWQQGYQAAGSESQYSHIWTSIWQRDRVGLFSSIYYSLNAGWFPNNKAMHFSAFKSFATVATLAETTPLHNRFALLSPYKYSTNEAYIQAHFNYSTPFLLLKRLPVLNNRLWNENIYVHYLTQPHLTNYTEVGYGLSQIFLVGEVAAVASFEDGAYKSWGIKFSWGF